MMRPAIFIVLTVVGGGLLGIAATSRAAPPAPTVRTLRPLPGCTAPETLIGDRCRLPCPAGQAWEQRDDGSWLCRAPLSARCKAPETLIGDRCRLPCPGGQPWEQRDDGSWFCRAPLPTCAPTEEIVLGKCFPKCPAGQVRQNTGKCAPPP